MVNWLESWTHEQGSAKVKELFERKYGTPPEGVWMSPGRVNLIGEHVDYNAGPVLPMALPHACYAAISTNPKRNIRMVSGQEEKMEKLPLDEVAPGAVEGWPAYVAGVAWALEETGMAKCPGFDIAIESCVPYGAGLSSSAALEGAVALGMAELCGLDISDSQVRKQLVEICILAENKIAGANTGGMDQTISLRGEAGHALYVDFLTGDTDSLPFDLAPLNLTLLVIDTRAPHSLNDGQYAERRDCCEKAADQLGVSSLGAAVAEGEVDVNQFTDEVTRKRVRHVVGEIQRCIEARKLMQEGPLEGERLKQAGALFNASHDSLRDDYEVSCPELNLAVKVAREQGAHGARMTGGGFGGSAIALVDSDRVEEIGEAIAQAYADRDFFSPQFLVATAGSAGMRLE